MTSAHATLGAYAVRFLASVRGRRKFRTLELYEGNLRNHLIPALGAETPLATIRRPLVRDFIAERLQAGYAPRTVLSQVKTLRALLSAALEDEVIEAHPALKLAKLFPRREESSRDKAMPRELIAPFLRALRRRHAGVAALVELLFRCGLRLGEGLALCWSDVDLDERVLHVRHALDYRGHLDVPKGGRPRSIDLSSKAVALLTRHRAAADPRVPWLFASPRGTPWARSYIGRVMRDVTAELGVPPYTAHALRHAFATALADTGTDAWALRDLLGHRDLQTTLVYVHSRRRHLAALERLDRIAP